LNLKLAPTYQPDSNEVTVDFRSTQDDLVTTTIADSVITTLYSQTLNAVGTPTNSQLAQIKVTADFIQQEQNYLFRFRNPQRKMNLIVTVDATYGANTYTATSPVGEGVSSHFSMELPPNLTWETDPLLTPPPQGEIDLPLTPVAVVLAPEIQQFIKTYDFTTATPPSEFVLLNYAGGGNRLLLSNRTSAYFPQPLNFAPWSLSAYLFMEQGVTNLIPNSFFSLVTNQTPTGFEVSDAGSAVLTQEVKTDATLATGAQVWTLRSQQGNQFTPFSRIVVSVSDPCPVVAGQAYCFSVYAQVKNLTTFTIPKFLTFTVQWLNGTTPIAASTQEHPIGDFQTLSLGSYDVQAPVGATNARLSWTLSPVDPGADVALILFAPQFELGLFPTSRTQGTRQTDSLGIPNYNAANQKIRMQFIPGFSSGQGGLNRVILAGPLTVTLTATQTLFVDVDGYASAFMSLIFAAGDFVDFTIEHRAGEMVKLYKNGILMTAVPLPAFSVPPATLTSTGTGMEITSLTVFSRA
jgi:hypothetical protein